MNTITLYILFVAFLFAVLAIRSKRLLTSALYLAGVSIATSIVFYLLGCTQVAVIELSVGAGLVTVLFVFSINFVGEETSTNRSIVPTGIVLLLISLISGVLIYALNLQSISPQPAQETNLTFSNILWEHRTLDVYLQILIFFAGVIGLLGLLAEVKPPLEGAAAAEMGEKRKRDLEALEARAMTTMEDEA